MPHDTDAQNTSGPGTDAGTTADSATASTIEKNLMKIAEELGAWLGKAERKTSDFIAQQNIADHLEKIRDTAARLLAQVEKGRERTR
jgi:hypothetical protein